MRGSALRPSKSTTSSMSRSRSVSLATRSSILRQAGIVLMKLCVGSQRRCEWCVELHRGGEEECAWTKSRQGNKRQLTPRQ